MNQGDKILLSELNITAEVDGNTIKNELIINDIKDLLKNEENPPIKPIKEHKETDAPNILQEPQREGKQDKHDTPRSTDTAHLVNTQKSFMGHIWSGILPNLKYLIIACMVIFMQVLLYHIPQINTKILEISPNHSTHLKMLISFVLIYAAQKELYRVL